MKKLIKKYFDTPEKRAKLYLLFTLAQIWAIIAFVIGIIVFVYFLIKDLGLLVLL